MEKLSSEVLPIYYHEQDEETAKDVLIYLQDLIPLITNLYGLTLPNDCRVYIMRNWKSFFFHAAPWFWWPIMILAYPMLCLRIKKLWPFIGGWMQPFGQRVTVGIKPPDLIESANPEIGQQIFVKTIKVEEKLKHLLCHELIHAFTKHLRLPLWLNEGIAMVGVDEYLQTVTVKKDTIKKIVPDKSKRPFSYYEMHRQDKNSMVKAYCQGYWLTRYLKETQPKILNSLLKRKHTLKEIDSKLSSLVSAGSNLWKSIFQAVANHYSQSVS